MDLPKVSGGLERGFLVSRYRSLGTVDEMTLAGCDALLFDIQRLEGPNAETYAAKLGGIPDDRRLEFRSSAFEARGDDLLLVLQGWRGVGERERILAWRRKAVWVAELPACPESTLWRSLELRVPLRRAVAQASAAAGDVWTTLTDASACFVTGYIATSFAAITTTARPAIQSGRSNATYSDARMAATTAQPGSWYSR